jgi:hypothetical protein
MPVGLHNEVRRIQLAIRFRERLREVPRVGIPAHPAWITRADIEWGERLIRERKLS